MLLKNHVIADVASQRYTIKFARTEEEIDAAFRLRFNVFKKELDRDFTFQNGRDKDRYDDQCHHLIVVHNTTDQIIGTYRLQTYDQAMAGQGFASGVRFQLDQLPEHVLKNAVEVGRACISEGYRSGRVLFLLWKGFADYLEHFNKRYLFGYAALETRRPHVALQTRDYLEKHQHLHPEYQIEPKEPYRFEWEENMPWTKEFDIPPLFQNYIEVGSKVCGGPTFDKELHLFHFLILFDVKSISDRIKRMFYE